MYSTLNLVPIDDSYGPFSSIYPPSNLPIHPPIYPPTHPFLHPSVYHPLGMMDFHIIYSRHGKHDFSDFRRRHLSTGKVVLVLCLLTRWGTQSADSILEWVAHYILIYSWNHQSDYSWVEYLSRHPSTRYEQIIEINALNYLFCWRITFSWMNYNHSIYKL